MNTKRIPALLCAVLMLAMLLSGCGGPAPTQEDTDAVMAAMEKFYSCESFTALQSTLREETAALDGKQEVYNGLTEVELSLIISPVPSMKTSTYSMMRHGTDTMEQSTISYILPEDGGYTEYYSDTVNWLKIHIDDENALSVFGPESVASSFFVDAISFYKAGEENIEGADALHFKGELAEENLVAMLLTNGHLSGISTMSENQQTKILDNLVKDLDPVTVSVWVDKNSGYPIRFECSMTEIVGELQESIAKTLGNKPAETDGLTTAYVVTLSLSDINAVEEFVLPAEAASAELYEG